MTASLLQGLVLYVDELTNWRVLASLRQLLPHPLSRVRLDFVAPEVIDSTTGFRDVDDFANYMRQLGKPLVFAPVNPEAFFAAVDYRVDTRVRLDYLPPNPTESRFGLVNCSVISPEVAIC